MENRNTRAILEGIVVSDKMDKTITIVVETYKKHAKYAKRVKFRSKYYAHDELNIAHVGDKVQIMQTRPLSATKSWRLVKVLEAAVTDSQLIEDAIENDEITAEEVK